MACGDSVSLSLLPAGNGTVCYSLEATINASMGSFCPTGSYTSSLGAIPEAYADYMRSGYAAMDYYGNLSISTW